MEEYIKRSDMLRLIAKWSDGYRYVEMPAVDMRDEVNALPSADVVERKHGKWIFTGDSTWNCSVCDEYVLSASNYCPNCGADMRGAE